MLNVWIAGTAHCSVCPNVDVLARLARTMTGGHFMQATELTDYKVPSDKTFEERARLTANYARIAKTVLSRPDNELREIYLSDPEAFRQYVESFIELFKDAEAQQKFWKAAATRMIGIRDGARQKTDR
jgi:hypothetical protein